jgi:hypothetical protein
LPESELYRFYTASHGKESRDWEGIYKWSLYQIVINRINYHGQIWVHKIAKKTAQLVSLSKFNLSNIRHIGLDTSCANVCSRLPITKFFQYNYLNRHVLFKK